MYEILYLVNLLTLHLIKGNNDQYRFKYFLCVIQANHIH